METRTEILRRRIALRQTELRTGVAGFLAIRYLRQIAEDADALTELAEEPAAFSVSQYLLQPRRSLFAACRQSGRDRDGQACPLCALRDICEAGRLC
jgi:hypothetical protein